MPDTNDTETTGTRDEVSCLATNPDGAAPCDLESEIGLRRSRWATALSKCYMPKMRRLVLRSVTRLEGGPYYSYTLRKLLWEHHRVYAGAYSYGGWTNPGAMPAGTVIGRYVSMAQGVKVFARNHPCDRLSTHPFFYNRLLGYVAEDTIGATSCWIGRDAWIGDSAIVTPSCHRIGIGAVVGAGSVVTKDVPDFAIVIGVPARLHKYRFSQGVCEEIIQSHWWENTIEDLMPHLQSFCTAFEDENLEAISISEKTAGKRTSDVG